MIELKYLAAYLPYRVKATSGCFTHTEKGNVLILHNLTTNTINDAYDNSWRLILRPLSDLNKEIEHNGEKFIPIDELSYLISENNMGYNDHYIDYENPDNVLFIDWTKQPFFIIEELLEWHFDIFGLIEKNFAIDINTIQQ